MLVLSRKSGERISIGKNVEVVVLKVMGNRVRLGIVAPTDVSIWRPDQGIQANDRAVHSVESRLESGPAEIELCAGV